MVAIDSFGRKIAQKAYKLANKSTTLKSNPNATRMPTVSDDKDAGYDVGSTWIYDNTTYTCVDSTNGKAVWQTASDIINFNTWSELVSAISVLSPSYIGKYAIIANANGAPSANTTYVAPNPLTDYIVDGGSATLKINAQGTKYSVTTQARTVTNPVVTSVMLLPTTKPTIRGYYIFSVIPTDGLPLGVNLNDIAFFDGSNWSCYQKYSVSTAVLVCGTNTNTQTTWRKFNGTWMNTADEYIPDSKEYQTGKLWNGKPVYRKCTSFTLPSTTGTNINCGINMPTSGTMIVCSGTATRYLSNQGNVRFSVGQPGTALELYELSTGDIGAWLASNATPFCNQNCIVWIEYTKN